MRALTAATLAALLMSACGGAIAPASPTIALRTQPAATASAAPPSAAATSAAASDGRPLYLRAELADVRTGERFTIGGSPGKVTLVLAMAVW